MWPFNKRKRTKITGAGAFPVEQLSFSQLDVTDHFGDNLDLSSDAWIATTPLNATMSDPERMGLPGVQADADEVFRIASRLSGVRESIPLPDDGVYCPICHIANIDIAKLRMPCPRCGRELLQFGWD